MVLRVQLVDDHSVVRAALSRVLTKSEGIAVVCESSNGESAIEDFKNHRPDVVVMDISLPPGANGIIVMQKILEIDPAAKVVFFSMYKNLSVITRALRLGAKGYIDKRHDAHDVAEAIKAAANDQVYLTNEIAHQLALSQIGGAKTPDPTEALTAREYEVFKLVAEGKSTADVESLLGINIKTVQLHLRNIMEKLGAHSVADLTMIAIRTCIIDIKEQ